MVNIIQGGLKTFVVRLLSVATGDPLNLAGVTEITTCFQNADGTELMLTYTASGGITVVSTVLGKIQVALTAEQTALLLVTEEAATLEVGVDLGNGPMKVQIANAYSVLQSVC